MLISYIHRHHQDILFSHRVLNQLRSFSYQDRIPIFIFFSLYDSKKAYRWVSELQILIRATLIAGLAIAGLVYFTDREMSRLSLVYYYIIQSHNGSR